MYWEIMVIASAIDEATEETAGGSTGAALTRDDWQQEKEA